MLTDGDFEDRLRLAEYKKEHPESVSKRNRAGEYIANAAAGGHGQTLELLKSFGIDQTASLDDSEFLWRRTVDSAFRLYCRKGDVDKVAKAIASGADVDSYDADGDTPLMIAAAWNQAPVVKMLLEVGADPTPQNFSGFTASSIARRYGASEAYELLKSFDSPAVSEMDERSFEAIEVRALAQSLVQLYEQHIVPHTGRASVELLLNEMFFYSVYFMKDAKQGPYAYNENDVEYINNLIGQVHSLQELRQLVAFGVLDNDWHLNRIKPPASTSGITGLKGRDPFEHYETRLICWKRFVEVFVRLGCRVAEYCGVLPDRCVDLVRAIVNDLKVRDEQREAVFVRNAARKAFEEAGYTVPIEAIEEPIQEDLVPGRQPAYSSLARLVYNENREWAIQLCETGVAEGDKNDAPFFLAWLLESEDIERSKELYQLCVENGFCYGAAYNLANLIKESEPERAEQLYQLSVDAGNTLNAAKNLAMMIKGKDAGRAKELFRMAIDAGDEFASTFQLALLVEREDPEEAKSLYERSIAAGDKYASTMCLANMLKVEDPKRAEQLYQQSIDAGNVSAYAALARLVSDFDRVRAIELCEEAVEKGDVNDGAFYLAWLCETEDVKRSMDLYQLCVDNNFCYGAAFNLGNLLRGDDPKRALSLYKKAAAAGRASAYNEAGLILMIESPEEAIALFEQGIEAGDKSYASCNLGHMLAPTNPDEAKRLYKFSLENEVDEEATEALIGLHLLLSETSPMEAEGYLRKSMERSNLQASVDFMAHYYDTVDVGYASRVRSYIKGE